MLLIFTFEEYIEIFICNIILVKRNMIPLPAAVRNLKKRNTRRENQFLKTQCKEDEGA